MVSPGMTLVKYLIFAFNLLFALSGFALIVVGALIQAKYSSYDQFMDTRLFTAPKILITVGVIVFVVASFGCFGAILENHCMIVTFSVFLTLIFILELVAGIAGYVLHKDVLDVIHDKMDQGLRMYQKDENVRKAWDIIQVDLHCCGVTKPDDWAKVFPENTYPPSCCSAFSNSTCTGYPESVTEEPGEHKMGLHDEGCFTTIIAALKHNSVILGGVGIGIAFIQIIGVVFSCCLARAIRKGYEMV